MSTRAASQRPCHLLLLPLLFLASPALAADDGSKAPAESDKAHRRLDESMRTLSEGSFSARLKVAEDACGRFSVLDPGKHDTSAEETVYRLQQYLWSEKEDWIAVSFLDAIGCNGSVVEPLFLDALASDSPNRRWRAYRWFARTEDPKALPYLEGDWARETREWARQDLVRALSRNHSQLLFDELLSLAEGEVPELASAAIETLKSRRDPRAIPLLSSLARESQYWKRKEAADALEVFPDSKEALAALLEVSDDENSEVRGCAIRPLTRMRGASGVVRVLAIAITDPDDEVRKRCVSALTDSPWIDVVNDLALRLPEQMGTDRDEVERLLAALIPTIASPAGELAPPGDTEEAGRDPQCIYQPDGQPVVWNPAAKRLLPHDGLSSARCFRYPEIPGEPEVQHRLPRGTLLTVEDHFEAPEESWVRVDQSCWMPASEVVPIEEVEPDEDEDGVLRRDFDLRIADISSPSFRELERAGMIRIIEPGRDLVGVSLRFWMDDPKQVSLLRRVAPAQNLVTSGQSLLQLNILWMLIDGSPRTCAFPAVLALSKELGNLLDCDPSDAQADDSDAPPEPDPDSSEDP